MTPTFGSLFAGVGGFDLGFETSGFECRFQVEWDRHCQQTLAHHWPTVPRWADVSDVNGAHLPPVDVITYGFPCQDLSVAGKRAGLDGNRSHLFFEAVRIITEMRQATNGRYPTWAVAENVAGLLNADNGTAMGRVVDELAAAGAVVIEWATLDAQWFGVPQRRRRVFIAACFDPATGDRCPNPLFPVAPSSSRNPATSDTTREEVAGTLGNGTGGRGNEIGFSHTQGIDPQPSTNHFPTLRGEGSGHAIAQPIPIQDGRDINKQQNGLGIGQSGDPAYTVDTTGAQSIAQPIAVDTYNGDINTDPFQTLRTTTQNYQPHIAQPDLAVRRLTPLECERLMGWPDDHTLHRADGTTNSDSTRYRMCGNGVAAPVAAWIAKHLKNTLT